MKTQGRLTSIQLPFRSTKAVISFEVTASPADVEQYLDKDLDITIAKHSKKRGLTANAMLWDARRSFDVVILYSFSSSSCGILWRFTTPSISSARFVSSGASVGT